jgi:thiol-disulfide isomerase/thioredoxin
MIDKHHLTHYVKAMARPLNSCRWPLVLVVLLTLGLVSSGAWAGAVAEGNAGRGGETLEVKSLLAKGKTTLIDFYRPFCPPCLRLAPAMEQLAATRSDLTIKKVNINRPGIQGIDWQSPLAQQYKIRRVPYFMVFSPKGKLVAEGNAAVEQVKRWFQEAGMMKR